MYRRTNSPYATGLTNADLNKRIVCFVRSSLIRSFLGLAYRSVFSFFLFFAVCDSNTTPATRRGDEEMRR